MSIQLHRRTSQFNKARALVAEAMGEAAQQYELTDAEVLLILSDTAHSWAAAAVRAERAIQDATTGRTNTPAGISGEKPL